MAKVFTGTYELHLAISEDIASGWIWIETNNSELRALLDAHRPVAKVSYNDAAVYCEVLFADSFDRARFDEFYGKHSSSLSPVSASDGERVFINHWYRNKLGIAVKAGSSVKLTFRFKHNLICESWYQANGCMAHPQVIVRVATWAGLVALGLGVLGVGLALLPLADEHALLSTCAAATRAVGAFFCLSGLIEIVWSTLLFARSRRGGNTQA